MKRPAAVNSVRGLIAKCDSQDPFDRRRKIRKGERCFWLLLSDGDVQRGVLSTTCQPTRKQCARALAGAVQKATGDKYSEGVPRRIVLKAATSCLLTGKPMLYGSKGFWIPMPSRKKAVVTSRVPTAEEYMALRKGTYVVPEGVEAPPGE